MARIDAQYPKNPLKLAYATTFMSSATYTHKSPSRPAQPRFELHSVDLTTWDDGYWADPIFSVTHPDELNEPWPHRFNSGQGVWIYASDGEWHLGKVVGQVKKGKTRSDEGLYWCVEFHIGRTKVRKWFAPLNGDIKPDTEHTQQLLSDAGWLESDSSDE